MGNPGREILTVGHSTLSYEAFLRLLRSAGVTAIADVRSSPYSRRHPHFDGDTLGHELKADGIAYVFLGDELGGRPKDSGFFCDGVADYERMAQSPSFCDGLTRVIEGAANYRVALMCSEHDPLDCHRCLLVGRELAARGHSIKHILADGTQKSQIDVEADLLSMAGRDREDFFAPRGERLAEAYRQRARRVAYSRSDAVPDPNTIAAE